MTLEMGAEVIPEFIREIFYPSTLGSFRDSMPSGELSIFLHTALGAEPTELVLKNMFPFMTLQDIKIVVYIQLKKELYALPDFQYLCIAGSQKGKKFLGGKTAPIDYTWNLPNLEPNTSFKNFLPFELAAGSKPLDTRFVESSGERKIIGIINRERITIEDAFFKHGIANGIPDFHVYFYKDLLAVIPGPKPPSEKEWNGRIYPFFPYLSVSTVEPEPELKTKAERMSTIFTRRQQFLMRLQNLLDENVPLIQLTLAGVKFLRLTWAKKSKIPGIEAIFYEAPVNERRPFMRLIPVEGSGISKIFLTDGKKPDIQDPKMLVTWSQERNPTPEHDYAFAKVLVRKGYMNLPPIYATVRLFNDGSADCIVEPPKGTKKLEPRTDLPSFGESLVEGLKDMPYITHVPDIGNAMMVLGVRLKKEDSQINTRVLRERLPVFTSFFQEISPLPGEKPIIMLRFKLVSNFATEDRIQTFITQIINRKILRGEGLVANLVELVADEFQIDIAEARRQVAIKLQAQGDIAIVNPETKDYMLQNNPGIDVAIFAQHPFYTFHLYRVDSLENLYRVITVLSLMISADVSDLQVSAKAAKELRVAEGVPIPEVAAVAAPVVEEEAGVTVEETADVDELADWGDLDYFQDQTTEEIKETETLAEQQGTPYPETGGEGEPAPIRVAIAAPAEELKKELETAMVSPKEELQSVKDEESEEIPAGEKDITHFYINKLKEADRRLFDYTKSHPSLKRYVSKCQPTHGRQPAVLSEAQFQRMQEEYADDAVFFQIFPLEEGDPEKPKGVVEKDYFTVLRYGTSPQNQNYYICCRFFCTKDEIMVRESDLESTEMRRPKGASKRPGECPFCKGRIIGSRGSPKPGETILQREVKPKTEQRHLFIRFLRTTPHPDGFFLPCCFLDESPIKLTNPAFDKMREWGRAPKTAPAKVVGRQGAIALEEGEEEAIERRGAEGAREVDAGLPISDYYVMLAGVTRKYIIGAEKLPLEVSTIMGKGYGEAQVGLLPTVLDSYFDQDPTELVSRTFNPQKIKENGTGFLRIAVENRVRFQNDSFLAAIAPFYAMNNAEQMKSLIKDKISPRIFVSLNYGNLALEFYDPANPSEERPTRDELSTWVSSHFDTELHEENQEALMRAYMGYYSFIAWLESKDTKKEFRHFALMLSQSNLIRRGIGPGTTFIVLDIQKPGKVSTRCPPYGYNADIMSGNNIGFLLHHWSGIWEPIFYVDNRPIGQRSVDIFTLVFQMANSSHWPPIVRKRLQEYMSQCSSSSRAAYTSQSKINPSAMIPSSVVNRILRSDKRITLEATVRDSYNHLCAILFKDKAIPGNGYIPLPVVDDGELITKPHTFLDWDDPDFKRAPVDHILHFYKTYIEQRFSLFPGYVPIRIVKERQSDSIVAIQLRNGLYVPAGPPSTEPIINIEEMQSVSIDVMEWSINHEISLEDKGIEVPGEKARMKLIDFHEIFEHLRLTFSNWLAAKEDGGNFRSILEDIIFSRRLPLFEKRKRLEILLIHEFEDWIATDFTAEDKKRSHETSLLRVDCRIRSQETCSGKCVWRKKNEEEGKCLLHVPQETQLGESDKNVSGPRVLLLRLIEELLRYGERRRQLLEQDVSRLAHLEKPVTIHGNQRIYPEKSAAWFELLRLEWAERKDEKPQFYEEMSRNPGEAPPLPPQERGAEFPASLELILNGGPDLDPKTGVLRLFRGSFEELLVLLSLKPEQVGIKADTTVLTDEMIRTLVHSKVRPIVQINLREDPPSIIAKKPVRPTAPGVPVFIITEDSPALLLRSPESPQFLLETDMPQGLSDIVKGAKRIAGVKVRPPAPPKSA